MPRWLARTLLVLVAALLALAGAEAAYRWMLFGGHPAFAHLRRPDLHADFLSEDAYWILYQRWDGRYPPPGEPHPVLGWVSPEFDTETLRHHETDTVGERTPVLLYGDSYIYGVDGVPALDALLDADTDFAAEYRALNYGVGGYGVDQVMLLQGDSKRHHRDPRVVVGVMPLDLDRAALCVRVGQKPCFELDAKRLTRRGPAIAPDATTWFADADPGISSYLWRKLLFASFTPTGVRRALRGHPWTERRKKYLALRILGEIKAQVAGAPTLWVVWDTHFPAVGMSLRGNDDWRDEVLRQAIGGQDAVWARDVISAELGGGALTPSDWIRPEDGHPTARFNEAMAWRVREWVLTPENPSAWDPKWVH